MSVRDIRSRAPHEGTTHARVRHRGLRMDRLPHRRRPARRRARRHRPRALRRGGARRSRRRASRSCAATSTTSGRSPGVRPVPRGSCTSRTSTTGPTRLRRTPPSAPPSRPSRTPSSARTARSWWHPGSPPWLRVVPPRSGTRLPSRAWTAPAVAARTGHSTSWTRGSARSLRGSARPRTASATTASSRTWPGSRSSAGCPATSVTAATAGRPCTWTTPPAWCGSVSSRPPRAHGCTPSPRRDPHAGHRRGDRRRARAAGHEHRPVGRVGALRVHRRVLRRGDVGVVDRDAGAARVGARRAVPARGHRRGGVRTRRRALTAAPPRATLVTTVARLGTADSFATQPPRICPHGRVSAAGPAAGRPAGRRPARPPAARPAYSAFCICQGSGSRSPFGRTGRTSPTIGIERFRMNHR